VTQENMTLKSLFQSISSASKEVPETNILEYIIIPTILVILIAISCFIFCLWCNRRQHRIQRESSGKKRIDPQTNYMKNIPKTQSFQVSEKNTNKNSK